jgi:hypothetical protein
VSGNDILAALLARAAVSLTGHPLRAARLAVGLLRSAPALAASPAWPRLPLVDRVLGRDGGAILSRPGLRAPPTPFNRSITQHRRWGFCDLPLSEVKRIKNAFGVTVRSSTTRCRRACSPTSPSSPCRRLPDRPPGWPRGCGWSSGPACST